jgi:murein DD-endopeptidase MepM/ murein hydrolase activator NlpD
MKKRNGFVLGFAAFFLAMVALVFILKNRPGPELLTDSEQEEEIPAPPPVFFGITLDTLDHLKSEIKPGESLGKLLGERGMDAATIHQVNTEISTVFDMRKMQAGKHYSIITGKNSGKPVYFIYEESLMRYLLVFLSDSIHAEIRERKVVVTKKFLQGTINSSLYETISNSGGNAAVAVKLADIYAWTIDFFRIQKGDSIAVIYEDIVVDDTIQAGVGQILAARFDHQNKPYYAFRYTTPEGETDYFDFAGKTMKRAFLKAPLQFSRISSKFTMRRFHPVQKTWKAHLGTDYAAPHGTPIMTTADGVVEKTGYTSGNGNYVKVKHNSTYSTQYLHMSKIAKGMKPGVRVRQGDVIGYVGSTGLATGPHVCYRFWKNGVQVDPLREKLPESKELDPGLKEGFRKYVRESYAEIAPKD